MATLRSHMPQCSTRQNAILLTRTTCQSGKNCRLSVLSSGSSRLYGFSIAAGLIYIAGNTFSGKKVDKEKEHMNLVDKDKNYLKVDKEKEIIEYMNLVINMAKSFESIS